MIKSLRNRTVRLALPLLGLLALVACAEGPRLTASWYLTNCTTAGPDMPCKPDLAGENIDDIHILIVNTGTAGNLTGVKLAGSRTNPNTSVGGEVSTLLIRSSPKQMVQGEFVILRMGAFPVSETNLKRCLIPVELLIQWNAKPKEHRIKLKGKLPTSLPSEWIEHCSIGQVNTATAEP